MRSLVQISPKRRSLGQRGCAAGTPLAFDLLIRPFVNVPSRTVVKYSSTTFFALFVFLLGLTVKSRAADLVVNNNAIINIFGDSFFVDTQAPSVGYRFPDYVESYFQLNYPKGNIHVFNLSRSGGTMDDRLTNGVQKMGIALWGYQN